VAELGYFRLGKAHAFAANNLPALTRSAGVWQRDTDKPAGWGSMKRALALALCLTVACSPEKADPGREPSAGAGISGVAGASSERAGSSGSSGMAAGTAGGGGATGAGLGGVAGGGTSGGGSGGQVVAGSGGELAGGSAGTGGSGGVAGGAGSSGAGAGAGGFFISAELASNIKETAPTTVGIVTWALDEPGLTEAHIDFGLDTTYGMTAPVDLTRANYRTVLVGMKPSSVYHFRIVATDGSTTFTSDDQTLTTGAPTDAVPITTFRVEAGANVDKGFIITSFWSIAGEDPWTAFILDTDGDVVWWYTDLEALDNGEQGFSRARLSADSQNVWLAQTTNVGAPLRRVSIDTLDVQTYPNTVGSHDICAVSGDTMAYLDYGETDCDSIVEIDKAGTTREVFESTGQTGEWEMGCHGNAVRYSKKEDVYVFSDDRNDVAIVERDGTVLWKLSEKVSGGNMSWGGQQHGVQLLDESLLIFANRPARSTGQALEFDLDGGLIKSFEARQNSTFLGDVQRLPSGGTLIDYSYSALLQMVDASDNVMLEAKFGFPLGYVEFRQSLYGSPLDIQQ
jgi:hypothetical protein